MRKVPLQILRFFHGKSSVFHSRQNATDFLKTLALVLPLTLLIWIYAERAQVGPPQTVRITMGVKIDSPNQTASIIEPSNGDVSIEIKGPTAAIERLRDSLLDASVTGRLRVPLTANYNQADSGVPVPVVDLLNNYVLIKESGCTVVAAAPLTIRVRIEAVETRNVPVALPAAGTLPFRAANPIFDPHTVKVIGPRSVLDQLFPTPADGVIVDLGNLTLIDNPGPKTLTGVQVKLDPARVRIGDEERVTLDPQRLASVRFEVADEEVTLEIRYMPIEFKKPLALEGTTVVTPKQKTQTNVTVRGPASEIDKLRTRGNDPPQIIATAVLNIYQDDRGKSGIIRQAVISNLPAGVMVVGSPPPIEFSVENITPGP